MEENITQQEIFTASPQMNAPAEQPVAPAPAQAGKTGEAASYGKFKTGEELWSAYRSLEAEFTKRSQRLKELEERADERGTTSKWQERVSALTREYPIASRYTREIGDYFRADVKRLEQENCLEKALLHALSADSARREAAGAPLMRQGGESPVAAPLKPRSIREAGELAVKMIDKNTRR